MMGLPLRAACDDEITSLKFTDYAAHLSVFFQEDSSDRSATAGTAGSSSVVQSMREGLFVESRGYVYHPSLLAFNLDGSVLWDRERVEFDGAAAEARDTLFNGSARLAFLREKPYPMTLSYERASPTVSVGLTDTFVQTNTRTAATLSLLPPMSPVAVFANTSRVRTEGEGLRYVMDDTKDESTLRLYSSFSGRNTAQLSWYRSHELSRSGSRNNTITPTAIDSSTVDFGSSLYFGSDGAGVFRNQLSYNTRKYQRESGSELKNRDMRWVPYLSWIVTPRTSMFAQYNLFESWQQNSASADETESSIRSGTLGARTSWENGISANADVHGQKTDAPGASQNSRGAAGTLSYAHTFSPSVSLQLSGGLSVDRLEQSADTAQLHVDMESLTMPDTGSVPLAHEFVVDPTDPNAIVVQNLTLTQTYQLHVDYEVETIGAKTYLYRSAGTGITPGEAVLVSYDFMFGGNLSYTTQGKGVSSSLRLYRYIDLFASYAATDQKQDSGDRSIPMNSTRDIREGVRAEIPLTSETLVGGELRYETHDEDISPSRGVYHLLYSRFPVPLTSTGRMDIKWQHSTRSYEVSGTEQDSTAWLAHIQSRPWLNSDLALDFSRTEDVSDFISRVSKLEKISWRWRIRLVTLSVEARRTREEQGSFTNEQTSVRALLRRDF